MRVNLHMDILGRKSKYAGYASRVGGRWEGVVSLSLAAPQISGEGVR